MNTLILVLALCQTAAIALLIHQVTNRSFRVKVWSAWTCRKAGGLFLGARFQFPVHLVAWEGNKHYTQVSLSLGFIFFTLHFDFKNWA